MRGRRIETSAEPGVRPNKKLSREQLRARGEAKKLADEKAIQELASQIPEVPDWLLERLKVVWREFNLARIRRALHPLPEPMDIRHSFGWEPGLADGEGQLPAVDLGGQFHLHLAELFG